MKIEFACPACEARQSLSLPARCAWIGALGCACGHEQVPAAASGEVEVKTPAASDSAE